MRKSMARGEGRIKKKKDLNAEDMKDAYCQKPDFVESLY